MHAIILFYPFTFTYDFYGFDVSDDIITYNTDSEDSCASSPCTDPNNYCVNGEGDSFECVCNTGFTMTNGICMGKKFLNQSN